MKANLTFPIGIAFIAGLFFIPFLGGVHLFDWDEINFAECAREMIVTGDYSRVYLDYQPFWQKPPLFFWLQAISMHLFGVNEFAARFPNAFCGILTLLVIFRIGKQLNGSRFGLIWVLMYFGSLLPHLYFKSGIIDPWFNLFIFLGFWGFIRYFWKKEGYSNITLQRPPLTYLIWGGFVLGLGILTKGPVALLIMLLSLFVFWILKRFKRFISILHLILFGIATAIVSLLWFGTETYLNGPWFVRTFVEYQWELFSTPSAGHGGFPGYHFVINLIGCFPASIIFIRIFGKIRYPYEYQFSFAQWMKILFWVVMILFSIVESKIVHYSSLIYFPLTYLAAVVVQQILAGKIVFPTWMKASLLGLGGLFTVVIFLAAYTGNHIDWLRPLIVYDAFTSANLDAEVHWDGWVVIPGIWLGLILLSTAFLWGKEKNLQGFGTLFIGTACFIMLTLIFFIKRIESYSQLAAIEFFEERQGEDVYVSTYGYHTYAHLFYTKKEPVTEPRSYNRSWLYYEETDKPVWVITKIHKTEPLRQIKGLKEVGGKNGFVWFYKEAAQQE